MAFLESTEARDRKTRYGRFVGLLLVPDVNSRAPRMEAGKILFVAVGRKREQGACSVKMVFYCGQRGTGQIAGASQRRRLECGVYILSDSE